MKPAQIGVSSSHSFLGDALTSPAEKGVSELLRSCAESNDPAAWERFIAHFHRAISLTVIRTAQRWGGIPHEVAADLIQDTYLKLCDGRCALLYRFSLAHPSSVEGYVKTMAANVTHDFFKSKLAARHGAGAVMQPCDGSDHPALVDGHGGVGAIERQVLLREIEQCLNDFTDGATRDRDRVVFWLYYQQGLSAREISSLPTISLTDKGVESVILRLTRQVRDRLLQYGTPSPKPARDPQGLRAAKSY
jgi:RNA polymerase sigma-70 factor (ECF subfamily)